MNGVQQGIQDAQNEKAQTEESREVITGEPEQQSTTTQQTGESQIVFNSETFTVVALISIFLLVLIIAFAVVGKKKN